MRGASMNVVDKIRYLLTLSASAFDQVRTIRLIIEPQEGGYGLVTSPDFSGYSFLLRPGEVRDFAQGHQRLQDAGFSFILLLDWDR
jgi:hypothetical protein